MLVVVGSQNPVKVEATHQAFLQYFDRIDIVAEPVESRVQPFPMSQQETITGALNRARMAREKQPSANFSVGIEGGLVSLINRFFIQAFAAVVQGKKVGLGRSGAIEVSKSLVAAIDPSSDKSKKTVDRILGRTNVFQQEGVMGVLTQNRLTRTQILRDAVICALPRFLVPEFYPEEIV
ncbi:MAG: DUF84 family protein [Candidatus Thorarchaeota archaeon]